MPDAFRFVCTWIGLESNLYICVYVCRSKKNNQLSAKRLKRNSHGWMQICINVDVDVAVIFNVALIRSGWGWDSFNLGSIASALEATVATVQDDLQEFIGTVGNDTASAVQNTVDAVASAQSLEYVFLL